MAKRQVRGLVIGALVAGVLAVAPAANATSEETCNDLGRSYDVMLPCSSAGDVFDLIGRSYD